MTKRLGIILAVIALAAAASIGLVLALTSGAHAARSSHPPTSPVPASTAPAPVSPTTVAPPPPHTTSGIPQGDGGDHDGDNVGGPSDGDGSI